MSDPCKFVGVEGEQCNKLHQVLQSNPCIGRGKTKRQPSVYNKYVGACIKAKGGIRKFGEAGPIIRQCAAEYKEDKPKGKFRYEFEMPQSSPSGQPSTLWHGRDLQAEWSNLYGKISGRRK
jgi:hypothetical protein